MIGTSVRKELVLYLTFLNHQTLHLYVVRTLTSMLKHLLLKMMEPDWNAVAILKADAILTHAG